MRPTTASAILWLAFQDITARMVGRLKGPWSKLRVTLWLFLLGAAFALTACSFRTDTSPKTVVQVFISQRNQGDIEGAMGLLADQATFFTASQEQLVGKAAIRQWLAKNLKDYFYKVVRPPVADGSRVSWTDDLYSNTGPIWVGQISMEATVEQSHIVRLNGRLLRGATGVICPTCPLMCPGSDTPYLPCH